MPASAFSTTSTRPAPARCVAARAWQRVGTMQDLEAAKHRRIVHPSESEGRILVQEYQGEVYAVQNKCTHLGLPIQGKVVGKPLQGDCVVCPFHNSAFSIRDGQCKGEWAPNFPAVPFVGKLSQEKPLKTYETRVQEGTVEVNVA